MYTHFFLYHVEKGFLIFKNLDHTKICIVIYNESFKSRLRLDIFEPVVPEALSQRIDFYV